MTIVDDYFDRLYAAPRMPIPWLAILISVPLWIVIGAIVWWLA